MKIKFVYCHNKRPMPVNGVFKQDQRCNRKIGGIDENLIEDSKLNDAVYHTIMFCPACHVFIDVKIENGEAEFRDVEKTELNFSNRLIGTSIGYKTRYTGVK